MAENNKIGEKELVGMSDYIQNCLITEMEFNVIDILTDASTGKMADKKVVAKRPFSKDNSVNVAIEKYLAHFGIKVEKKY